MLIIYIFFVVDGVMKDPDLNILNIGNSEIKAVNSPFSHEEKEFSLSSINTIEEESETNVFAFYRNENHPYSQNKISLQENISQIDVLVPNWFYLNENAIIEEKVDPQIDVLARENKVKIIPSISLNRNSNADYVHEWLSDPNTTDEMIKDFLNLVKNKGYQGIHLDFYDVHWADRELFNQFVADLYETFHSNGLVLTVFVRIGDATYDAKVLSEVSDHIIIKAFDQHIEEGEPGPLASMEWTNELLNQYNGPMEKLVVVLANYGYDWNITTGEPATPYHFSTVMELVTLENLKIQWDEKTLTPYVRYKYKDEVHIVEFLDGATFYNQMKLAKSYQIPSIGIWNIGSEDPSVWNVIENNTKDSSVITNIPTYVQAIVKGNGDYLDITQVGSDGIREVETERQFIMYEEYASYPTPFQLEKFGTEEKKVAISFDDGPSREYTGKILDILNRYDVKASFFLIGRNASVHPDIVKRIYNEGHEIGSHTFNHLDILDLSEKEMEFELNSTQRVVQGVTGHSTVLFRPPYLSIYEENSDYPSLEAMEKILKAEEMGYTVVTSSIDPRDWDGKSVDEIVDKVKAKVENGQIILLHDAGGDRTATLEALPRIIEWLKAEGYEIVPSSELVEKDRTTVMPTVNATEQAMVPVYSFGSTALSVLIKGLNILLLTLIIIGFTRIMILMFLSWKQKRSSRQKSKTDPYLPFVSIVIAAYNEEKVIRKTIQSIIKSKYPRFELIIVDDGSTDETAKVVESECRRYANIRLIRKENGGKSTALNVGIRNAAAEFIVTLDADTIIAENAISSLVQYFKDTNVGAVSGNVKIGNRKNLLTSWQHIEYVTGFNLEKRALDELNSVTVVPGAIGAWRKQALMDIGLFEEDTLAEDTDATLKLLRKGYKVKSEESSIAFTEAPENVKSFVKQRYRWTYGILQCIWKHKRAFFNPKNKVLGFFALPNLLFQYVLLAVAPIADLILILAMSSGHWFVVKFYLAFLLVDTLVSVYSFSLEKESKKPLITLFIQRLIYRQFFTFVVYKSILFAIKGQLMGWNKLQRTGSVYDAVIEERQRNVGV